MRADSALTFSMLLIFLGCISPIYAQDAGAADSDKGRSALFFATNPTGDFNATGTISSIVYGNRTIHDTYIVSGNWSLLVSKGNVTGFEVDVTMVSTDGNDRHTHTITNFMPNAVVPVILDVHGSTFTGVTDMTENGEVEWSSIQTTVTIAEHDAIKIMLNTSINRDHTDNHFNGQPIYGIVSSIREYGQSD